VHSTRPGFASILVITYGRSGSTLLQGLLNSIDDCIIRGENNNLCYGLFLAYKSLLRTKEEFGSSDEPLPPASPWYGAGELDSERYIRDARALLRHQLVAAYPKSSAPRYFGFKEIRYLPEEIGGYADGNLEDYLNFLAKVFPRPAFIVLTRDHAQVANSAWWKTMDPLQVTRSLREFDRAMASFSKGKRWVFQLTYDDMVKRTLRLRELFEFLGAPYDAERVEKVLSIPHSYASDPAAEPSAKDHRLRVERPQCVAHVALDNLPDKLRGAGTVNLGGVVVLADSITKPHRLVAVDGGGEHLLEWGIFSPIISRMLPFNRHARNARFRGDGLRISPGKPIDIFLEDDAKLRQRLIRIHLTRVDHDPSAG